LDRAVWRRFQLRLNLPLPTQPQAEEWFRRFEERLGAPLEHSCSALAMKLKGLSFSELEQFGLDVQRRYILSIPEGNVKKIVSERLEQWSSRFALR
jgi:AAA+ superfamily predicted ATPase